MCFLLLICYFCFCLADVVVYWFFIFVGFFVVVLDCCWLLLLFCAAAVARVLLFLFFGLCSCLFVFLWLEIPHQRPFPCNFRGFARFLSQNPFLQHSSFCHPFCFSFLFLLVFFFFLFFSFFFSFFFFFFLLCTFFLCFFCFFWFFSFLFFFLFFWLFFLFLFFSASSYSSAVSFSSSFSSSWLLWFMFFLSYLIVLPLLLLLLSTLFPLFLVFSSPVRFPSFFLVGLYERRVVTILKTEGREFGPVLSFSVFFYFAGRSPKHYKYRGFGGEELNQRKKGKLRWHILAKKKQAKNTTKTRVKKDTICSPCFVFFYTRFWVQKWEYQKKWVNLGWEGCSAVARRSEKCKSSKHEKTLQNKGFQ